MSRPFVDWTDKPIFLPEQKVLGKGSSRELDWALEAKKDKDSQVPKTLEELASGHSPQIRFSNRPASISPNQLQTWAPLSSFSLTLVLPVALPSFQ